MSSGSDVARAPHEELGEKAPIPRTAAAMGRLKAILLSDRAARWTARLSLILIWQLVGELSDRMPTPVDTFNFIIDEFQRPFEGTEATWWNNQVVQNTYLTIERTVLGMFWVIVIGIPLGYAMGTWWRAQATFTDVVMVGLALPGYIWALLSLMWFGFSVTAPVFTVAVSATPALVVFVMRGTLAIPRELLDMSRSYEVPFLERFRNLVLPSMAGAVIAGVRLAILAGWGLVLVTEWFGLTDGAGQQSRSWYDAANFDGLMGWALIIIVIIIVFDRGVIERIDRRAHKWRGNIEGFGTKREGTG